MPELSIAFQTDKLLADYGPLAARVESLGFDAVSVYNDMLYQPAWPALFEMARHTKRIRLGPAAVNPFLAHPISLAGELALLDEASNGRAYLGLSRGAWLDYVGAEPERPVSAMREAFAAIRHLLRQDKAPLDGTHFPIAGGDALRWDILRPDIPFMLGSWGLQTIRACRPFIGEVKLGGTANPELVRWILRELGGHPPAIVVGSVCVVDEDGDAARAAARRRLALYLPVVAALDPTAALEPDRLQGLEEAAGRYDFETAARFISDEILAKFAFAGTPGTVAEQVDALLEAGASRIEFGAPHGLDTAKGIRLLGKEVIRRIKTKNDWL